jgi:hypothetical protein
MIISKISRMQNYQACTSTAHSIFRVLQFFVDLFDDGKSQRAPGVCHQRNEQVGTGAKNFTG